MASILNTVWAWLLGACRRGAQGRIVWVFAYWRRRRLYWAAALLTATTPIAASRLPVGGATVVILGDSYTANGDLAAAILAAQGWTRECKQSLTSWPSQLLQQAGLWDRHDFYDVSCLGASLVTGPGYTLAHEVRKADDAQAFGPRTQLVALQLGINDAWGDSRATTFESWLKCLPDLSGGCDADAVERGLSPDFRGVTGEVYANRIRDALAYIRYRAPRAHIVVVGYPEMHSPGQRSWCIDALGIGRLTQPRAGAMTEFMDRLDTAQREAARSLSAHFFDTRAVTTGHGLCTTEPWLNGLLNVRREFSGIPFHPTEHGDAVVAAALKQWIKLP